MNFLLLIYNFTLLDGLIFVCLLYMCLIPWSMLCILFIQVPIGVEEGERACRAGVTGAVSSPTWLLRTKPDSVLHCRDSSGASSALFWVAFVLLWLWFELGGRVSSCGLGWPETDLLYNAV